MAASWMLRGGHRRLYGMTSAEDGVGMLVKRAVGDGQVVGMRQSMMMSDQSMMSKPV